MFGGDQAPYMINGIHQLPTYLQRSPPASDPPKQVEASYPFYFPSPIKNEST